MTELKTYLKFLLKKFIRKTYHSPWFFIAVSILIWSIIIWQDGRKQQSVLIDTFTRIKDRQRDEKILTENDRYIKVTTFYSEIIARYGLKYHRKNEPNDQGLTKYQKPDFIQEVYEVTRLLDLPTFSLMAKARIETSFGPECVGDNGSAFGMYQHHQDAVGQAKIYFDWLPRSYQKRLGIVYRGPKDLEDPINATRVEGVLQWGLKRQYRNDIPIYITASHWGIRRIDPYYKKGVKLPRYFKFNVGTIKEDIRNPFMYYYIWNAHISQWNTFSVKVNIDKTYLEKYRRACSKQEWNFIQSWKYVKQLRDDVDKIEKMKLEFETKFDKQLKHIAKKAIDTDEKYRRIYGLATKGKFRDYNDLWPMTKALFKGLAQDLRKEKEEKKRKIAITIYLIMVVTILLLASFAPTFAIIKVIVYIRNKSKHIPKKPINNKPKLQTFNDKPKSPIINIK